MQDSEEQNQIDERFMREALKQAAMAREADEVPIGAVIVSGTTIIARGHNQTEKLNDATAHAEMLAFTSAFAFLNGKYLTDCTLYVTIEPCVMCAGAAYWAQLSRVVYGAPDEKRGFHLHGNLLHPKTIIKAGVLQQECSTIVKDFFVKKRK